MCPNLELHCQHPIPLQGPLVAAPIASFAQPRPGLRMDFEKSPSGTYIHDDESFFPIDGQGWNDTDIGSLARKRAEKNLSTTLVKSQPLAVIGDSHEVMLSGV